MKLAILRCSMPVLAPILILVAMAPLADRLLYTARAGAQPASIGTPALKWQRCPPWYCETGWYASPAAADTDGDGQIEVVWGGYTLMAANGSSGAIEWIRPQGSSSRLWPGIAVADLDRDGQLEIVTGSGNGYVSVYDAAGSPRLGWPKRADTNEIRSLAVADVDGDRQFEIIVASTNSSVNTGGKHWWVYEPDGSIRPGWPRLQSGDPGYAAGAYNENVGVGDIDRDGRDEIIGPSDVHYITAYHDDGSQMRADAIYGSNKVWSQVGVHVSHAVDLRGYAMCGPSDPLEPRPNFANSAPSIADLNGDGVLDVVVVGNNYDCRQNPYRDLYEMPYIFNADRARWSSGPYDWTAIPVPDASATPLSEDYGVIENSMPNPVMADLDGDGRMEILFASYDGRLHAYWLDKTEHGSWPFRVYSGSGPYQFASEPAVADLDGDGKAEVIVTTWTQHGSNLPGKLYILSWSGQVIQSVDLPRNGNWGGSLAAPTIANIDGDPDLEVVVGTVNAGLVAYDLPGTSNARIWWGTGRGNIQRTGSVAFGSLEQSTKSVSNPRPRPGDFITYIIRLVNPGPTLLSARLTDTLPSNAFLVGGSVSASSGSWGVNGGLLTWSGSVTQSLGVTVTYVMTVDSSITLPTVIVNSALIADGLGNLSTRVAGAVVNGYAAYLPVVMK